MSEQEILDNAPEGAEDWTHYDGQDYFKISNATVLDYIFLDVWCPDSKKWIEWIPVENLRSRKDIERIAELESFISDYANQECNCGYPKVCSTCRDIAYAKEILKGGAE